MLYSITRLYKHQNEHENKLIECLAYSNGVSFERMRDAYHRIRQILCKQKQK